MSQIYIDNQAFDFDIGVKLAKLKYDTCPFDEVADIWNDIVPFEFKDIKQLTSIEQRRIAISILGIERVVKQVDPKLIDTRTIKKSTTWINREGKLETVDFKDTYELYEVALNKLFDGASDRWGQTRRDRSASVHYVKFKDTSTDREYFIWVDAQSVYRTNNQDVERWNIPQDFKINAIQAIAWTIQTNLPIGFIDKIIRQGDCILIKPKNKTKGEDIARHLTEKEYRDLLVAES